jgi:hypothetical protein
MKRLLTFTRLYSETSQKTVLSTLEPWEPEISPEINKSYVINIASVILNTVS